MRIVTYLNSANRLTPTHSFLITTFYNFFSDVNIRGFGTLIPYLRRQTSVWLNENTASRLDNLPLIPNAVNRIIRGALIFIESEPSDVALSQLGLTL